MLIIIIHALREESVSHTWVFEWQVWFRAGWTSTGDDQHTDRAISITGPNTVVKLHQLAVRIDIQPSKTVLKRLELIMGYVNGFQLLK
jgi:hypothetical protein